jgi:hypothetical protein
MTVTSITANLVTVINAVNDWGKQYWGLLLVLFVIGYFVRKASSSLETPSQRRFRKANRFAMTGTPYMRDAPSTLAGLGSVGPPRDLYDTLRGTSDADLVRSLSPDRILRLRDSQDRLRGRS